MTTQARLARGCVVGGLAGAGLLLAAGAAPGAPRPAAPAGAAAPVVMQGRVAARRGRAMTLQTPAQRPACGAGHVCPTYIVAGRLVAVDLTGAVYESPQGQPLATVPPVGSAVVVVGARTGPDALRASVVERIDQTLAPRSPSQP